ncbi:transposase family protein [Streptomyces sp. NPDC059556]|uniref:transposase family protein n=1 Tax=Streptomyces sp. NPDC059556 TaxID=3346863 RepID=UPI0036C447FF
MFSTHHASSEEPRPVPYRAAVDVPHEPVEHVSRLIYPPRRERRSRWRKPGCFQQALLALVHLRKNETLPALAAGFGISTATSWRCADEILDVLAAWAPGLYEALTGPGEGNHVIAGATLRTPYRHQCGQPEHYQQFNRDHARLRAPGERAFALLKSWRPLRRARCSTRRISTIVQAVHTLLNCSSSG